MSIRSVSVNGTSHKIDYLGLDNLPDLTKDTEAITGSDHFITSGAVASALNVVRQGLNAKVDAISGKGLSTNDYVDEDKNKLSAIEAEATKTIVDAELSAESDNPVANRVLVQVLLSMSQRITALEHAISGSSGVSTSRTVVLTNVSLSNDGIVSFDSAGGAVNQNGILAFPSGAASLAE